MIKFLKLQNRSAFNTFLNQLEKLKKFFVFIGNLESLSSAQASPSATFTSTETRGLAEFGFPSTPAASQGMVYPSSQYFNSAINFNQNPVAPRPGGSGVSSGLETASTNSSSAWLHPAAPTTWASNMPATHDSAYVQVGGSQASSFKAASTTAMSGVRRAEPYCRSETSRLPGFGGPNFGRPLQQRTSTTTSSSRMTQGLGFGNTQQVRQENLGVARGLAAIGQRVPVEQSATTTPNAQAGAMLYLPNNAPSVAAQRQPGHDAFGFSNRRMPLWQFIIN